MRSYTTLRNTFGTLTNNLSTANLALADTLINDSIRRVCADRNWDFLFKTKTFSTVASQQSYDTPYDYDRLESLTITNGTTQYTPDECPGLEFWNKLNQTTSFTSDTPEYFYILGSHISIYPTPASAIANGITINYRRKIMDLSMADYTTGTVTVTTATTTITGSGTTWTKPMVGRFIRITPTNTAGASGDGSWYEITDVSAAGTLTIDKAYNGMTITVGTTYTIGEMPVLPEAYHDLPLYEALMTFYTNVNPDATRVKLNEGRFNDLFKKLKADYGNKTTDPTIKDFETRRMVNPNLFIQL